MAVPFSTPRRDLFGDIAVAKGFLTWAKVRDVLRRQLRYKEMGIPMRIGEVAVEMGLLTSAQRNEVLAEQTERRKSAPAQAPVTRDFVFESDGTGPAETYQFSRYRLDKRLGGVMSAVYRGVDTQTGNPVALKVLPKNLAFEPALVERFKREVRTGGVLAHPNIVRVYDAGVEKGVFFMAMEYIEGETLTERLRRERRLVEHEGLRIARFVARALAHAHSHNVFHRDVKPDNIMLAASGAVKLTDFGLAKLLADHQQITAEGIAVGTPHYIAPEQARALPTTDHRADLYALGATFFQAITGRLPYEGDDGAEIMRRHVFEPVPDPRIAWPGISAGTAAMLMRLMAKDPAQRYQTAGELVAYLDSVLGPDAAVDQASVRPPCAPSVPAGPAGVLPHKGSAP
ncbi:MAG: serine/threonine-protein kinase [Planctomycetota bacterium]|nr:serine/threonine-protein kinase [Planctomycetota bacterium]